MVEKRGQTPFDLPPGGVCLCAEFGGGGDQGVGQRVTAGELVRRVLPGVLMARFPVADDREGAAVFGGDGQRNHQLPVGILAHRRAEDVHHPPHEGHGAVAEKLPVAGCSDSRASRASPSSRRRRSRASNLRRSRRPACSGHLPREVSNRPSSMPKRKRAFSRMVRCAASDSSMSKSGSICSKRPVGRASV